MGAGFPGPQVTMDDFRRQIVRPTQTDPIHAIHLIGTILSN